ncbi:uncharacterized protein LOC135145017 [Zophobas morio]|uniref:uncharacterized protein LOC135145017 n=1 Tax=Zophobas morio TaxID=2755281 RepID=UPI003083073A
MTTAGWRSVRMSQFNLLLAFPLFCSVIIPRSIASSGNEDFRYQYCTEQCSLNLCSNSKGHLTALNRLNFLTWTCKENCQYDCMMKVTEEDIKSNKKIKQFHGRWPFKRIFGIQDPASTLFSLLNLFAHLLGWRNYSKQVNNNPLRKLWKYWFLLSCNAWVWSAIFHAKDTAITEKLVVFLTCY